MNKNTAKNGYKEENLVCNDLNSNIKLQSGKKSSNQIQFKLIFSELNIRNKLEFIL